MANEVAVRTDMAGATATVRVEEGGRFEVPEEIRRELDPRPGNVVTFRVTGPRTVEFTVRSPVTMTEMFGLEPLEGPVDMAALREEWEAAAADEFMREVERNRRGE